MNFEKYFTALDNINANRALNLLMNQPLSILEIEALLKIKHDEAKNAVLSLKEAGIIVESSSKKDIYVQFKIFEKFEQDNKLLYDYLRHEYKNDDAVQKDIRRQRIFNDKHITIEEIIADKEGVIRQIERK